MRYLIVLVMSSLLFGSCYKKATVKSTGSPALFEGKFKKLYVERKDLEPFVSGAGGRLIMNSAFKDGDITLKIWKNRYEDFDDFLTPSPYIGSDVELNGDDFMFSFLRLEIDSIKTEVNNLLNARNASDHNYDIILTPMVDVKERKGVKYKFLNYDLELKVYKSVYAPKDSSAFEKAELFTTKIIVKPDPSPPAPFR